MMQPPWNDFRDEPEGPVRCAWCGGPTKPLIKYISGVDETSLRCTRCCKVLYPNGVPKNPIEGKNMCRLCKSWFVRTRAGQELCPKCEDQVRSYDTES